MALTIAAGSLVLAAAPAAAASVHGHGHGHANGHQQHDGAHNADKEKGQEEKGKKEGEGRPDGEPGVTAAQSDASRPAAIRAGSHPGAAGPADLPVVPRSAVAAVTSTEPAGAAPATSAPPGALPLQPAPGLVGSAAHANTATGLPWLFRQLPMAWYAVIAAVDLGLALTLIGLRVRRGKVS